MTLAQFILERIAEDEADARRCRGPEWSVLDHTEPKWGADDGEVELLGGGKPLATFTDYGRNVEPYHITRWDPARALAECEAKRWIVASHPAGRNGECVGCGYEGPNDDPTVTVHDQCPDLRNLATVYADHPDYREEWRP